ncbi:DUF2164 family protein [Paraburkholderia phenoliruptrix]|uniref:DUF2164 family protein n=1 Tax=Paraburkholderia phenoliruptrix TaxID=252970 RepID=UPI0035A932A9
MGAFADIAAGALLGFFFEDIGPNIYNEGVVDAQERLLQRVSKLACRTASLCANRPVFRKARGE